MTHKKGHNEEKSDWQKFRENIARRMAKDIESRKKPKPKPKKKK